ncbi:ABC-2 type transport system permease protein [Alkalibaculum bacchi]|uniref:ABC-2 type transport system permease protein n=1 Tax=Alkalibaculum bacchi TaxID=645887 RepID=A0A366HXB3_9FIRM|nr:ABC transporter permease subunit [Alkalibaculum bacchi]RBP57465.1 ABC-2 type transport system permease protein [Alkalibaculum bacchi]
MNVFIRELKFHRKSLIMWSIAIFFMIVSSIGKFTAYAETGQSMNELLSQIPSSIKAVLGMGNFDLTKLSGFYGMLYLYLLLLATVHASLLGATIISKEERDKTTEFLMVKPISRVGIITAKIFAALFNIVVFNLITLIFSITLMGKYAQGENITSEICVLMLGMFILQLMFLFIGTATAAVSRRPKKAASASTTVLLICFIISSVINMNSKLEPLKYITPFEYFKADKLLNGGGFEPIFLFLSFVIIAVLMFISYVFYKKRDLNI